MFERSLKSKLQQIFAMKKATFDEPGESQEQDCLFIQVDRSRNSFKDGRAYSRVEGRLVVFAAADKLPFAYMSKSIAEHPDEAKDFFFFEIEENTRTYQNIVQRSVSFVYFFNSQYDPAIGTITSIETEVST